MSTKLISTASLLALSLLLCSACYASSSSSNDEARSALTENTIKLSTDFSDANNKVGAVYDFFDVAVRTQNASVNSFPADFGQTPQLNAVRMLGGWASKDIAADAYKWNGSQYVYDFAVVTNRIDGWLDAGWEIFQIVLDNPPWAFQRGFEFVDEPDGKHYLKKDANGVYGNGLPPDDPIAWHQFIQSLTTHLIKTYGKDKVVKWRFRVGSEIDTRPQHWAGTRQEFFEHYKNTVEAVHSVLPQAQIGAHFREASFKGRYIDYSGNTEDAYAPHFIAWAKAHKVHYDFVAISYYPHITNPNELDMQLVYQHDIAPIQQHPDWDPKASFEIHEFKLISKMERAGFISVNTSHGSAFFAMLSKLMLENNIKEVFQWGTGHNGDYVPEALTQRALLTMIGNALFTNTVVGTSQTAGNRVDGIFTQNVTKSDYDILLFNFNNRDLTNQNPEKTLLSMQVAEARGTAFRYRIGSIDNNNNSEQLFISSFPKARIPIEKGGWWNSKVNTTASNAKALNAEGQKVYLANKRKYNESNSIIWGDWLIGETSEGNSASSLIEITTDIPSFAVQKVEVRFGPDA